MTMGLQLQQQQQQAYWKVETSDDDSSWVNKFDLKTKKKKKKPLVREDGTSDTFSHRDQHFAEDHAPDCQSEQDYSYEELLSRVYDMLREDNVEVSTGKPRTVMMPPQLLTEGTQRTVCINFGDLCRTMRRKPEHIMRFILTQIETKGMLNNEQWLEMKGIVSSKDFEAVLRTYIGAFVTCSCCKCPNTALAESNGVLTLRCEMCGSVVSIKEPNPL